MSILPSLLVYSEDTLESKLSQLPVQLKEFELLTNLNHWGLHIDVILPQFALQRNVSPTLSISKIMETLFTRFQSQKVRYNIHIMGEGEEILGVVKYLTLHKNDTVFGEIYVPASHYDTIPRNEHAHMRIGAWYDVGEWNIDTEWVSTELLLMTVQAGTSGQKAREEIKQDALNVASAFEEYYWVLDGGWKTKECKESDHIEYAVNTDFWKNI